MERAQFVPDYLGCNASASPGASRCDNRSPVELLNQFAAAAGVKDAASAPRVFIMVRRLCV